MLSLARSELVQIFRNRLVLISSFVLPIAVSAYFIYQHDIFAEIGSLGYVAAILIFTALGLGMYSSAVTTLAARRQTLFLKRLRSTTASDAGILIGLMLPLVVLVTVQITGMVAVLALVAGAPSDILLLVVAIVASLVMMIAMALATAGLTNSPEHAQVTTLPIILGVIGVATWVGITGTENLQLLKRLLPGGAATELIMNAWNGGVPMGESLLLLGPIVAWVGVSISVATKLFKWEPRR